ncbi:A/G-specific adenine glycosylase [Patescibacteria group bacterium]|nr:A/G-specific adenine glycosylase [Patescibacteria group bacterium]MBU1500741.1 A/G-specific adenine glycosylase [Patescibacteria group bacterium]MBU2080796.1 A/G-specific adenine glycosylase [Patescibacteria group bacterium]MBU2123901.1 A/G-specific adenine glycosylase [Patescibacteria group bacterium]MBU2194808.1 A/G-specific adenine glycosylase [Patescibacteria group bacterium]
MTPRKFRELVLAYYASLGRHTLPWRKTRDPYHILVSEMMLQQTQVERVVPYYTSFLKKFPSVSSLAKAPLSSVLREWQGLGYNRRAKYLKEAAQEVVALHGGVFPKTPEELQALPGIGSYTARAVCAFAYNTDVVCIETNIRTVVLHHFFSEAEHVSDAEVLHVLEKALPKGNAREWYAALMDYGTYLKRTGASQNKRSTTYKKQKAFKGSRREVRGALLKALVQSPATKATLLKLFPKERVQEVDEQITVLLREGLIQKRRSTYTLAD